MSETPEAKRRKRGGQPGNRNAMQHGLYARQQGYFQTGQDPVEGLTDQIAMLRLAVRETARRAEADPKPEGDLELLRAVTAVCAAINRMVRTNKGLEGRRTLGRDAGEVPLPASPIGEVSGEELAEARTAGLEAEIALLTGLIERVTGQLGKWKTLGQSAAAVRGLAMANGTLAMLIRTQRRIRAVNDPVQRTLRQLNAMNRQIESRLREGELEEEE